MAPVGRVYPVARQRRDSSAFNTLRRTNFILRLEDRRLKPIPNAPYLIRVGGARYSGHADSDGWLERKLELVADDCMVYWSVPRQGEAEPAREEDFEFRLRVYLRFDEEDREESVRRRLHNAGFPFERGDEEGKRGAVMAYQMAYADRGLDPTGDIDDKTINQLTSMHDDVDIDSEDSEQGGEADISE